MFRYKNKKDLDEWIAYALGNSTFTDEDRDKFIDDCVQEYHDKVLMEKIDEYMYNNTLSNDAKNEEAQKLLDILKKLKLNRKNLL